MKMDFVIAVANSWRETPSMQALVGLLAVIALIYHLHFCQSSTRNEKVVPVWMMGNIILVEPIGYGLLLKNVIWAFRRDSKRITSRPGKCFDLLYGKSILRKPFKIRQFPICWNRLENAFMNADQEDTVSILRCTVFK